MAIRIYSKNAVKLTLIEEKSCAKLITNGSIYSLYVECCTPDSKLKNRVFLVKDKGVVIGWSVIQEYKRPKGKIRFQFMVYIKKSYRRRGFASELYKRSKKYFKLTDEVIRIYATTAANSKFFRSIRPNLQCF